MTSSFSPGRDESQSAAVNEAWHRIFESEAYVWLTTTSNRWLECPHGTGLQRTIDLILRHELHRT